MGRKVSPGSADLKPTRALALAAALALVPGVARGQEVDARAAQAEFERFRVARLPWSHEPRGGPCDEVVGRFCYRHEGDARRRPPPAEPAEVPDARDTLLARLDAAAARAPGDGWILGQRVRYRIEAGRPLEAAAVAASCGADGWWCAALEGAGRHAAGEFAAAERAFDRALASMPAAIRERWADLGPVLDGSAVGAWGRLGPGGREAFARRAWWAADPLWSVPGNERRTEHLSRHVWDRLQEGAASAYDVAWGDDLSELLVRYGWPVGWERIRRDVGRLGGGSRPGIVAHDPPGARRFVPTLAAIADPAVAGAGEWPLDDPAPRSTYAPAYASRFVSLEPQIATFRRGAEAIVVAGWALPVDSLATVAPAEAALLVSAGPDVPFRVARASGPAAGGALQVRARWARAVVGVEVVGEGIGGRWRSGLELPAARPDPPAVSDLLLLDLDGPLPASLDEALPLTRPTATVIPGERLGVFWEAYPEPGEPADPVTMSLALHAAEAGPGARLARALRLADAPPGARLRWHESLPPLTVAPRAVALQLPDLPPGRYVLELELRWPRGRTAVARREVSVVRP
ncbi:MAG TPA: hypothetical protein VMR66_01580 [Gemmatimonadota bacterium]|nr:hypothetical protein [Gemmatimonadota bacterium]